MNAMRRHRGFTLMEVMVVVVILGILATVVTLRVNQYLGRAKVRTAKVQMKELMKGLELYKTDHNAYPESLDALIEATEENPEGFLASIPFDPWGNEYEYVSGTEHGFDLVCYGRDGQEGGEGVDADLNSWELDGGATAESLAEGTTATAPAGDKE